ncbi:phosphoglycolate phosphatase [Halobacterium sp. CBA1126]|uniref:phosphoglycolate phosphatase n=1 Tax=Halobacterium sp. CBA1126 TaxID=2668074 RepID=UPI0012FABD1E|nr:phosphoglycolate phosphatase [Halobacterium sp. CBA1126]MUV61073.1 phosphoglycolate phosphatase [Halobacterium sp. CBA1126]
MVAPLAVDIDGTLSRPDRSIDSRVLDVLREWEAPVVIATGKALPYPVALCQFVGVAERVIAENGGVAYVDDELFYFGDRDAAADVREAFADAGFDLGWGEADLVNRWRETELAVNRERPLDVLTDLADEHGLSVVDTGFAYHVKATEPSKGAALEVVAEELGHDPAEFAAVGDSANDVELFEVAGESYAVANADDAAREAAEVVLEESYADGFLEAVERVRGE